MTEPVKCGANVIVGGETTSGDLMHYTNPCQGFLLPCERPVFDSRKAPRDNGLHMVECYIAQEKYWKCSLCNREVK